MNKYGFINFKSENIMGEISFYVLFRINEYSLINDALKINKNYLENYDFCKIEKVLINTDTQKQLKFRFNNKKGITFKWSDKTVNGSEFGFPLKKVADAQEYIVIEFEDDDSALLWFKLNYGGL